MKHGFDSPRTGSVLQAVPTLLVLVLLAAVGYFGHAHGWRTPTVAALFGTADEGVAEDWCATHNVPDSECLACRPTLTGADPLDWCREHGVPESQCTVCHPEILTEGAAADWCNEHGTPESQCTICHPEIAAGGDAGGGDDCCPPESETEGATEKAPEEDPDVAALKAAGDWCAAHGVPESRCAICNPGLAVGGPGQDAFRLDPAALAASRACLTHALRVQFASPAAIAKAGVELIPVTTRGMAAVVTAHGEVDYDRTRFAQLAPKTAGTVWRVEKDVGEEVRAGDVLVLVDSAEVGAAKAELLQAMAQVDVKERALARIESSAAQGFRTTAELQEAEAEARGARIRLFNARQALTNLGLPVEVEALAGLADVVLTDHIRFLGLPPAVTETLDSATATANLLAVRAPFDGTVLSRDVVAGEVVGTSVAIVSIADVSRMWIQLDVALEDAGRVEVGQTVTFAPDVSGAGEVAATVAWMSTAVDHATRTVRVRADVDGAAGRLRANTFGTGTILLRRNPEAVAVPDEAVHWEGCCHVVFVQVDDAVFQTRKVRLGAKQDGHTEILVGLLPGETIAVAGSYVLKSEILKSRLGAGCVDD